MLGFAFAFFCLALGTGFLGFGSYAIELAGAARMLCALSLVIFFILLAVREAEEKHKWIL